MNHLSRFFLLTIVLCLFVMIGCSAPPVETPAPGDDSVTLTVIDPTPVGDAAAADDGASASAETDAAGDATTDDGTAASETAAEGEADGASADGDAAEADAAAEGENADATDATEGSETTAASTDDTTGDTITETATTAEGESEGAGDTITDTVTAETADADDATTTTEDGDDAAAGEGEAATEGDTAEASETTVEKQRRIEFPEGANGTIVGSTIAADVTETWLVGAEEGQTLSLNLFPYPTKTFTVVSPSGEAMEAAQGNGIFLIDITETGDHTIAITGEFDGAYSLTVELFGG